jgi:hypothetical protein
MLGKKNMPTPITEAVDKNIQTRKSRRARDVPSKVISVMIFLCFGRESSCARGECAAAARIEGTSPSLRA